jgi:hypothetical protein
MGVDREEEEEDGVVEVARFGIYTGTGGVPE